MKTKLLIVTVLLMSILCGCSKNDEHTILGEWFWFYSESSWGWDPENLHKDISYFSREDSYIYTFMKNGHFSATGGDIHGVIEGTWKIGEGNQITILVEDDIFYEGSITFDGTDRFWVYSEEIDFEGEYFASKHGWQRL